MNFYRLVPTALLVLSFSVASQAANPVGDFIRQKESAYQAVFEDLHRNPELSMKETRTAKKVADALRGLGFTVTENVGGTGVVGVFNNGPGKTVLIRAEMDALPVQEQTGLPYQSQVPGVAHACGHDFHVASLLAAADYLVHLGKANWHGTLLFIGQPGEETAAGAAAMINDPHHPLFTAFPRPDLILGLHNQGTFQAGLIRMKPDDVLASNDSFDIQFNGIGGAGYAPNLAINPVKMLGRFSDLLDQITTTFDPQDMTASIGVASTGTKRNVIAPTGLAQGMIRTYDPNLRAEMTRKVQELAQQAQADVVAKSAGKLPTPAAPIVKFLEPVDVVHNDQTLYQVLRTEFTKVMGANQIVDATKAMASDDFGSYSDHGRIPELFWFVGSDDLQNPGGMNHNPKFRVVFHPTFVSAVTTMITAVQTVMK